MITRRTSRFAGITNVVRLVSATDIPVLSEKATEQLQRTANPGVIGISGSVADICFSTKQLTEHHKLQAQQYLKGLPPQFYKPVSTAAGAGAGPSLPSPATIAISK